MLPRVLLHGGKRKAVRQRLKNLCCSYRHMGADLPDLTSRTLLYGVAADRHVTTNAEIRHIMEEMANLTTSQYREIIAIIHLYTDLFPSDDERAEIRKIFLKPSQEDTTFDSAHLIFGAHNDYIFATDIPIDMVDFVVDHCVKDPAAIDRLINLVIFPNQSKLPSRHANILSMVRYLVNGTPFRMQPDASYSSDAKTFLSVLSDLSSVYSRQTPVNFARIDSIDELLRLADESTLILVDSTAGHENVDSLMNSNCHVICGGLPKGYSHSPTSWDRLTSQHWYTVEGHQQFEKLLATASNLLGDFESLASDKPLQSATALSITDRQLPNIFMCEKALHALGTRKYSRIIIMSREHTVPTTLGNLGLDQTPIFWLPTGKASGIPSNANVPRRVWDLTARLVGSAESARLATAELARSHPPDEPYQVLFCTWTNPKHAAAALNTAREQIGRGNLIVVSSNITDEHRSGLREYGHDGTTSKVREPIFLPLVRYGRRMDIGHFGDDGSRMTSAAFHENYASDPLFFRGAVALDLCTAGLAQSFVELHPISAQLQELFSPEFGMKFRHVINLIGRMPTGVLANAIFRIRDVATCDAYLFTVANSAKQVPSSADLLAVVDTVQKGYVSNAWQMDPTRVAAIGYLWSEPEEVPDVTNGNSSAHTSIPHRILVGTQSGFDEGNRRLVKCVALAVKDRSDVNIVVRLHPAEPRRNFAVYRDIARDHGGCIDVEESRLSLESEIDMSFAVVTQTSNIGIEAASRGRVVIKYLVSSGSLDSTIIGTPYSHNITVEDNEITEMQTALFDRKVREATLSRARDYLQTNSGLNGGNSARKLVDFVENYACTRA